MCFVKCFEFSNSIDNFNCVNVYVICIDLHHQLFIIATQVLSFCHSNDIWCLKLKCSNHQSDNGVFWYKNLSVQKYLWENEEKFTFSIYWLTDTDTFFFYFLILENETRYRYQKDVFLTWSVEVVFHSHIQPFLSASYRVYQTFFQTNTLLKYDRRWYFHFEIKLFITF